MEPISAREWGQRQAAAAPVWSENKWRRVGAILGVEFVPEHDREENDDQAWQPVERPRGEEGWRAAA